MKPKCLLLTPSLYWGGAEQWMYDLVKYGQEWIDWVGVVSQMKINNDENMILKFLQFCPIYLYGNKALNKALKNNKVDVVICWGDVDISLLKTKKIKTIWCAHGCGKFDLKSYKSVKQFKPILAGVSEACLEIFDELDKPNVKIIHNGVDPERVKVTKTKEEIRQQYNISPDQFIVGYLGRLVPEKNLKTLAYAILLLPENYIGMFVGSGWDFENQKKEISNILGNRAIFTGRVTDVGNYFNAFDCNVLVSPKEGFSMSLLEAMMCGTICVSTEVGILPFLKQRFGRRYWIPLSENPDPIEIADKILMLSMTSKDVIKHAIFDVQEWIKNNFTADIMAKNWAKFIYEVIGLEFNF